MLYTFFWVNTVRLYFICRRFGIFCSILIGGVRRNSCLHRLWR